MIISKRQYLFSSGLVFVCLLLISADAFAARRRGARPRARWRQTYQAQNTQSFQTYQASPYRATTSGNQATRANASSEVNHYETDSTGEHKYDVQNRWNAWYNGSIVGQGRIDYRGHDLNEHGHDGSDEAINRVDQVERREAQINTVTAQTLEQMAQVAASMQQNAAILKKQASHPSIPQHVRNMITRACQAATKAHQACAGIAQAKGDRNKMKYHFRKWAEGLEEFASVYDDWERTLNRKLGDSAEIREMITRLERILGL